MGSQALAGVNPMVRELCRLCERQSASPVIAHESPPKATCSSAATTTSLSLQKQRRKITIHRSIHTWRICNVARITYDVAPDVHVLPHLFFIGFLWQPNHCPKYRVNAESGLRIQKVPTSMVEMGGNWVCACGRLRKLVTAKTGTQQCARWSRATWCSMFPTTFSTALLLRLVAM